MKQPPLGWTTEVNLDRIIDGDTIVVEVSRTFIIRVVDDEIYFDTPETFRPSSEQEREKGKEATQYLYTLLTKPKSKWSKKRIPRRLVLHIPGSERGQFKDSIALSRLKGMLWADEIDVVDEMIKKGYVRES